MMVGGIKMTKGITVLRLFDGSTYNQMQDLCGDGWTVDVIVHIFRNLLPLI